MAQTLRLQARQSYPCVNDSRCTQTIRPILESGLLRRVYGWACISTNTRCPGRRAGAIYAGQAPDKDAVSQPTKVDTSTTEPAIFSSSSSKSDARKAGATSNSSLAADELQSMGITAQEFSVANTFLERVLGATIVYGLTLFLASLSGVDVTATLDWGDGTPFTIGAMAAALPLAVTGLLLLPSLDLGLSTEQLFRVAQLDVEEEVQVLPILGIEDEAAPATAARNLQPEPALTPASLQRGLWLHQMQSIKPWFEYFDLPSTTYLLASACAVAASRELFARAYLGALLTGWYQGLLTGATDVNNPFYWAKVFKLLTPDTPSWLAAATLCVVQVGISTTAASRAARFTRLAVKQLDWVDEEAGAGEETKEQHGNDAKGKPDKSKVILLAAAAEAPPCAEERVVYGISLATSALISGATNLAWAASGSVLGSYTVQVCLEVGGTLLQRLKESQGLPDRAQWGEVQSRIQDMVQEEDD
ncbi:hypothetical protein Agub_g12326, partial [Astrephomene gubernaculifera]